MNLAKIDTAKSFLVGPILDADGVAVTAGLTRANINVSKNGSVAASNASSTLTHNHTGHWIFAANAADISALGEVEFSLNATTNAMVPVSFQVVTANWYDTASSTDVLEVDLISILGTALTETAGLLAGGFKKFFNIATPTGTVNSLPDAVPGAANGLPVSVAGIDLDTYLQKGLFSDGMVWIDSVIGTASTALPYGSAPYPTDTIANGKIIADALGLRFFQIHGAFSLAAPMEYYSFSGSGQYDTTNILNFNTHSIEHSEFSHMIVTGEGGNGATVEDQTRYIDCLLLDHTNINGIVRGGSVSGACSIRDTGYALFSDVFFGTSGTCSIALQAPTLCTFVNLRGTVTFTGMDSGTCSILMQNGADITFDNTCTAGTVTITGTGTVTDNSGAGCTVNITEQEVDTVRVGGTLQTANDNGADINAILADTNELQADDIPGKIVTLDAVVDTVKAETALIVEDTGTTLDILINAIPTNTELAAAFTEIKGATWSATTDTLEHIRNKQTDIETDTAEIGTAGAGLTEAGGTGDHLIAVNLPNQTMDITGNLSGSVGSVTGAVGSVTAAVTTDSASRTASKADVSTLATSSGLATAQTDLDTITGSDGVTLATAQALYAPNVVVPDVAGTAATLHGSTDGKIDVVDGIVDNILTDTGTTLENRLIAIEADTNELQTNQGAWTTATGFATPTNITAGTITTVTNLTNAPTSGDLTATMKASVNAEADTALTDIHLDHLLAVDYDPTSKPGVATSLLNEIVESDAGVSRFTVNSLENAPSGTGASAESIRIEIDSNSTQLAAIVEDTNEINQSMNGKVVIDREASTFKVYDTDGVTLLFTVTKTTAGSVDTLTRT